MIEAVAEKIGRVLERPDRLRIAALARWAAMTGGDIETSVRLVTGQEMTVLLPDVVSTCLAYDGVFEPEVQTMIARELPRGGTFFDVGAHFGACSLMAVSFGASRVVGFEPAPKNLRILRMNCAERGITVVDRAVSDQTGVKLVMRIFGTKHCASNTLANPRLPESVIKASPMQEVEVETVTIDDYVAKQEIEPPNVIKVDVENYTRPALAGARQTLTRHHPAVIVEVGGYGSLVWEDVEILRTLGYSFYRWVNTGFEPDQLGANDERNILAIHTKSKVI